MGYFNFICVSFVWISYLTTVQGAVRYAKCLMEPNPNQEDSNVRGEVNFRQMSKKESVEYRFDLTGFDASDDVLLHATHVHMYGTITDGCESAGGHYNPRGKRRGGHDDKRLNKGDLGNIEEDGSGNVNFTKTDYVISLAGRINILGRTLMVHAGPDDLGQGHGHDHSAATGNGGPGPRVACCVIVASDGSSWATP